MLGDVAKLWAVELHAKDRCPNDELFEVGVVVERVEEHRPTLVECQLRANLVDYIYPWRHSNLNGKLGQQPLGERVERRHGSDVGVGQRLLAPVDTLRVAAGPRIAQCLLELDANSLAQLGGRSFGKRDRSDLTERNLHGRVVGQHQLNDSTNERCGFARAGTGFDEERAV